jgi:GNAT superfamily N-acetyltransferase
MGAEPLVRIRLAAPEDSPAVARILADAFAEFRPLYTAAGFRATVLTSQEVAARLSEGPVWLARFERPPADGGRGDEPAIGTLAAVVRPDGVYLRSMGVAPVGRGNGVGLRLLEEAERFAVAVGHRRMFLSTAPVLKGAIRLYERFGFRRTPEGPHDLHGTPLFSMEKRWAEPGPA